MSSSNESYLIHVEESTQTISPSYCLPHCFYIKLHQIHSTSSQHYIFLIPRNILCNYDDFESLDPDSLSNIFLHNTFSSVPISPQVLEETLLFMSEYARHMNSTSYEMDVFLETTSNVSDGTNVSTPFSSLEKVEVDDDIVTLSCSICLEEFHNGSKQDIVSTKCMHIFHQECVDRWFRHCCITNRSYSCPMCRSQI